MATPKLGDFWHDWVGATQSDPAQLQSVGPVAPVGPQPLSPEELAAMPPEQRMNIPVEMMPAGVPISQPDVPGFGQSLKYAGGKLMSEYPIAATTGLTGLITGGVGSSPAEAKAVGEGLMREAQLGKGEQKAPTTPQIIAGTAMANEEQQKAASLGLELPPPPQYRAPALTASPKDIDKAYAIKQQALADEQLIKEADLAKKADLIAAHKAELAQNEEAEARVRASIDEGYQGYQKTQEDLSAQLKNMPSVNPDRYWQNKSGFQKGMSALAGFLFGLSGKGMDYLHLIDQEIERDVNAQKFDIEGKRRDIGTQLQTNMNVYGMFKERGFNSLQAVAATRIHKIDQYDTAVKQLAAETDSKLTKVRAEQASSDLMQERVKWKMEFDKVSQTRATLDYQARQQQWEYMMQAQARQASALTGKPMQEGARKTIVESQTMGDSIKRMAQQYRAKAGGAGSGLMSYGVFGAPAQWQNTDRDVFTQLIGKTLEGGVLKESDFARYHKSFIPSATDTQSQAENKISNLVDYAESQYRNEYEAQLKAGNTEIKNYMTPAQYAKSLRGWQETPVK